MGTSQSRNYGPTPKFLLVSDQNMKEMIDIVLEKEKRRMEALKLVKESTALLTLTISCDTIEKIITVFGTLLGGIDAKASFYERYTNRMIDRSLTKFAVNDMNAEIKAISKGCQIKNPDQSDVKILLHSCEKILINFENRDHVFYQHPLITAPYLIAFSQLYLSVIEVGMILMPNYKVYNQEKQRLKKIMEEYKVKTITERIEMIKIKETFKRIGPDSRMIVNGMVTYLENPSQSVSGTIKQITKSKLIRDVDAVEDPLWNEKNPNKLHYWDRGVWDEQQGTKNNDKYTDVVSNVYEEFFDKATK